jgi:hypothetical protein
LRFSVVRDVIKEVFGRAPHLESANGTPLENRDYCCKDGDFIEIGLVPAKGSRTDLARVANLAVAGKPLRDIAIAYPVSFIRHSTGVIRLVEQVLDDDKGNLNSLEHEWWYGDTGTGKSRKARTDNPCAYIKEPTSIWWDGYKNEDVVIIDDFDKFQVSQGGAMKRWLDHYPFQGQKKGSMRMMRPKKIIVTSNYHPREIWDDPQTLDPILRRVKVVHFSSLVNHV